MVKLRQRCVGCVGACVLCFMLLFMDSRIDSFDKISFLGMKANRWSSDLSLLSPSNRKPSDILIIGYLRGGTTFLGEILGLRNDSFYVYEPLHKMAVFGYFKPGYQCSMHNKTCKKSNHTDGNVLDIVRAIYNCDTDHYKSQLGPWQHLKARGSDDWKEAFPECNATSKSCVENIYYGRCLNRRSKVSKVPRLSVSLAAKLLDTFFNLKIIHLLRDPRAIMVSRAKLKWTTVPGGALSLCQKMNDDYLESEKMKRNNPERLLTVFYEDMATKPEETLRKIYNFVGYELTRKEKHRIAKKTGSLTQVPTSNTYRSDSAKTAYAWRNNIKKGLLIGTNTACHDLYGVLGYPQLGNLSDVRNSSIPLRKSIQG